ncbi:hypothetical protein OGAPHI_005541 [Ogataea philodendri]|uniref:Phosphatidic acid phosphatase type 2/haloperoxidase domain-containing protein n=1 Tax=Ogataea philodendri TaxID=1378263 RepID=A0A9P8NZT8_9ASCO|nr:uncharacterized protein OGAPHI_005541 [Ogataea philodendri]KAH3662291.1 hypothetical protein OGAPHI_005541 [Ogataea philodendri]
MATEDLTSTFKNDSGLQPESFYTTRMDPYRFRIRSRLLKFVQEETPRLAKAQRTFANKWLDIYFTYSANLGSHTFYVLCLPVPLWFELPYRDLVYVLGLGIFLSGAVKDYLCLPRPRSPPLVRKTMSHYTAEEYGCPSSHSANAFGVFLLLSHAIITNLDHINTHTAMILLLVLFVYLFSMVFGRVYCGMHGIVDIVVGSTIGGLVVLFRWATKTKWDTFLANGSMLAPISVIAIMYSLIYYHPLPIDHCPCFEDSVAFIGVLIGLDLAYWGLSISSFRDPRLEYTGCSKFELAKLGYFKTGLRLAVGIGLLAFWKAFSKPLIYKLLKPIHARVFAGQADKLRKMSDCAALQPRYNLNLIVRVCVYTGIAALAVSMGVVFSYLGLALD